MTIKIQIAACSGQFSASCSSIKQLLAIEPTGLGIDKPPYEFAAARGWAFVWLAAALEVFWAAYLDALCKGLSLVSTTQQRRHLKAQTIFFFDQLQTIGEGESVQRWKKSAALIESLVKDVRTPLATKSPYDGRTVRPEHLDLAWELFSLDSPIFPSLVHRTALELLANRRNDVAHGKFSPITVGRLSTKDDVLLTVDRISEIVDRCVLVAGKFG